MSFPFLRKPLIAAIASTAILAGCSGDDGAAGEDGVGDTIVTLSPLATFDGTQVFDESAAEIVSFDPNTNRLFVVNANAGIVDVIDLSNPDAPVIAASQIDFAGLSIDGFTAGGVNSVDVNVSAGVVAVAIENDDGTQPGVVAFFDTTTLAFISSVTVGVLPDAVVFSADGNTLLVANEGEPVTVAEEANFTDLFIEISSANDPEGSISVVDVSGGFATLTDDNVAFVNFDVATLNTVLGGSGLTEAQLQNAVRNSGIVLVGNGTDAGTTAPPAIGQSANLPIGGPPAPNQLTQVFSIAQDFEPEFIAVSPIAPVAWVTLQENNAVAIVSFADPSAPTLLALRSFGAKDHSVPGNALDLSDEDGFNGGPGVNIQNWPVFGMFRPDTIAAYEFNGATFWVTANEGDAREIEDEFEDPSSPGTDVEFEEGQGELIRAEDATLDPAVFPANAPDGSPLLDGANLGRIEITTALGDLDGDSEFERLFAFGARSFSIWSPTLPPLTVDPTAPFDPETANDNAVIGGLTQVFDSGDDFEVITANVLGENFNNDNDGNDPDSRSDDAGPEPEALAIGEVSGRTFAFIGLERVGGIFVYDISNPFAAEFVQYLNLRNFDTAIDNDALDPDEVGEDAAAANLALIGDLGPESIEFISADNSPNGMPLIAVGNEVSGTTTIFQIDVSEITAE